MRILVVCALLVSVPVLRAQTIQSVVQMPPEWGPAEVWRWVEADGNHTTREVIVRRWSDLRYLVVRLQPNGSLCHGNNWFFWGGDPYAYPDVVRPPGLNRDRVYATIAGHYVEMSIDVHPGC